jgi:hypothetical protein
MKIAIDWWKNANMSKIAEALDAVLTEAPTARPLAAQRVVDAARYAERFLRALGVPPVGRLGCKMDLYPEEIVEGVDPAAVGVAAVLERYAKWCLTDIQVQPCGASPFGRPGHSVLTLSDAALKTVPAEHEVNI